MRKGVILAAAFVAALAWSSPAKAETILFDRNGAGAGGLLAVDTFDWAPGNTIIRESTTVLPGGAIAGTILFQANLGTLLAGSPGVPVFANGTGGNFFTAVAAFDVAIAPGGGVFSILPGGSLQIFATAAPGNDLAGTGFNTGLQILQATAINGSGNLIPTFLETPGTVNNSPIPCVTLPATLVNCLDQFGLNNYAGFFTINGTGGTTVNARVTSFNNAFFVNLIANQTIAFTNTSNNLPFREVNPSANFFDGSIGVASTCGPGQVAGVNCVNGTGNNIIAQADANTSFIGVTTVPEPASMTLLGLGLLGAAARRRKKNAK